MPCLETFELPQVTQIEALLNQRVLVLAASSLDMELLPTLHNILSSLPESEETCVLLYGRGGEINAARRVALLLKEKFKNTSFVIPYYCQSSFTTLALSGDRLFTGPMTCFSPIDTHLEMLSDEGGSQGILASEDIRLFSSMAEEWFGINATQNSEALFASVAPHIYPTTLTSLYRSIKEQQQIAHELLALNSSVTNEQVRKEIVDSLMFHYHSHSYALTGKDLAGLGLPIIEDDGLFSLAWGAVNEIMTVIGGQARDSLEEPRNDCLIMTSSKMSIRQNYPNAFRPKWFEKEF